MNKTATRALRTAKNLKKNTAVAPSVLRTGKKVMKNMKSLNSAKKASSTSASTSEGVKSIMGMVLPALSMKAVAKALPRLTLRKGLLAITVATAGYLVYREFVAQRAASKPSHGGMKTGFKASEIDTRAKFEPEVKGRDKHDVVDQASMESFPASDAPAY